MVLHASCGIGGWFFSDKPVFLLTGAQNHWFLQGFSRFYWIHVVKHTFPSRGPVFCCQMCKTNAFSNGFAWFIQHPGVILFCQAGFFIDRCAESLLFPRIPKVLLNSCRFRRLFFCQADFACSPTCFWRIQETVIFATLRLGMLAESRPKPRPKKP